MKNFEIKWEDPNTLQPHPKNDELHPHQPDQIKRLAKLIKAYGWRHPIIVSKRSGFIIVGHGRWMAALEMKAKEVPVHYQDFASDDEELGFLIADNGIGEWTKLDLSRVNAMIPEFDSSFDVDWLGIKNFEIDVAEKFDLDDSENQSGGHATSNAFCLDVELPTHHEMMELYDELNSRGIIVKVRK